MENHSSSNTTLLPTEPSHSVDLIQIDSDDGVCVPYHTGGKPALAFYSPLGTPNAYFRVTQLKDAFTGEIQFQITIGKDHFPGLTIEYDSSDDNLLAVTDRPGAFKNAILTNVEYDGEVVHVMFYAPDAHFRNRVNGADFRVVGILSNETPLTISKLTVGCVSAWTTAELDTAITDYDEHRASQPDLMNISKIRCAGKLNRMRHMLQTVTALLEEAGLDYWLDRGTLLGAFRNGRIIETDDDIDLRVLHCDWMEIHQVLDQGLPDNLKLVLRHHTHVVHRPDPTCQDYCFVHNDGKRYAIETSQTQPAKPRHVLTAMCVVPAHLEWFDKPNLDLYCVRVNEHGFCGPPDHFYPWLDDGKDYFCLPSRREQFQVVPCELVYPMTELQLEGRRYRVPGQVEPYLKRLLGYLGENAVLNRNTGLWEPGQPSN